MIRILTDISIYLEKKAVLYGEPEIALGIANFLAEIGIIPVLCATGTETGRLETQLREMLPQFNEELQVIEGVDFDEIAAVVEAVQPDLLIGNSKGYPIARKIDKPLIRVGFPIHDRIGGAAGSPSGI